MAATGITKKCPFDVESGTLKCSISDLGWA